jgi:short-subunit dehydrogenase
MSCPRPDAAATCLITGASAGIGVEIARELAQRGYGVTLSARRPDPLERLAEELRARHGVTAGVIPCDLRDEAQRLQLVEQAQADGQRVDVLVNNAGLGGAGRFHRTARERALDMVRTNILALVDLTRLLIEPMVARQQGAILNVGSTAGFQPIPSEAVYSASKAFVRNFSDALSLDLKGTGVTCTTLCPGPTRTEFAEVAGNEQLFDELPGALVADARSVAAAGVEAMLAGKRVCVPGMANKIGAVAGGMSPRPVVLKTLELFWPSPAHP